ncbi:MAG: BTAD domain-containing putative transcriptional regulator, partial [Candidatus Eremiobacterota bacterium]
QARSLLAQARLDPSRAISQKAEALLEGSPEDSRALGLQVFLLGKLRVVVGAEEIGEDGWPTRKIRSLLACLASARGEPISEEKLMARFWEHSGERARHSLHNSVSQIRRVLGERLGPMARRAVVKRQEGYVLNRDFPCWVDLEEFRERLLRGRYLAERGRWDEALVELQRVDRLYRGEFLEGIYEEWCEDLRLKCLGSLIEALQLLARYFLERGKPEVSADYWRRILARDNCHEDAYLGLMHCSLQLGRPGEAVKIYHQCGQVLKKELNLSPPPRMVELYLRTIRQEPCDLTFRQPI